MARRKKTYVEHRLECWGRWVRDAGPNPHCYSIQPFHPKAHVRGRPVEDESPHEEIEALISEMRKSERRGYEMFASLVAQYATPGLHGHRNKRVEFARLLSIRKASAKLYYSRLNAAKEWLEKRI